MRRYLFARLGITLAFVLGLGATLGPGAAPAHAAGVVGSGTPASCTEAAFDSALAGGGSLTFDCGPAPHDLLITSVKTITSTTTIDGANLIALNGGNATRVFVVNPGVTLTLSNLTIRNAYWTLGDGGAVRNDGTLIVNHSQFLYNQTSENWSGGAILSYGTLTVADSEFAFNRAGNGGAVYPRWSGSRTTITGSSFHDNRTLNATNGWGGALLLCDGAPVSVDLSTFSQNAARDGGAIYVTANSVLTVTRSTLSANTADDVVGGGGALYNNGSAAVRESTLSGNQTLFLNYGGGFSTGRRGRWQ